MKALLVMLVIAPLVLRLAPSHAARSFLKPSIRAVNLTSPLFVGGTPAGAALAVALPLSAGLVSALVELAAVGAGPLAALGDAAGLAEAVADFTDLAADAALEPEALVAGESPQAASRSINAGTKFFIGALVHNLARVVHTLRNGTFAPQNLRRRTLPTRATLDLWGAA